MTRNGYPSSSHKPPPFRQVEIARADGGSRRLFRSEVNGKLTGFVEKRFRGETKIREFAVGGLINGINEEKARLIFGGVEPKPEVTKKKNPVTVPSNHGLPEFITKPEPMMAGTSARSKPVSTSKVAPATKLPSVSRDNPKRMTRKEGLALAGSLLRTR